MNVIVGPVYKSAAFWTMVVATAVQLAVGIGYGKEATMMGTIAATVITYLVARGVIVNTVVKSHSNTSARF